MPQRLPIHRPPGTGRVRQKRYDEVRGKTTERGYGADWRRLRDWHLRRNPLCRLCLLDDRVVAASDVDHIVAVTLAPERRLDPDNLQSLCHPHHMQKEAEVRKRRRNGESAPAA
jgi:5-methylcytosine-specific restriction endonuclease McrA